MKTEQRNPWNSLEVAKLAATLMTPLVLFCLALIVNESIRETESDRIRSEYRQAAVQELSTFIYERRSRSALLLSALRRHSQDPVPESMQEVIERKRQYDEAYFNWNGHHQANLLLVRQILNSTEYSKFEAFVELRLVREAFTPIDQCLTQAYDITIRGRDPNSVLAECNVSQLMQLSLDCGFAITDALYRVSGNDARPETSDSNLYRCGNDESL